MSYVALYRKYRPKTFDEVYGQSAIVQTLTNQIMSQRIGHAYLFSGPRGTGKTSISKIFAQAINCTSPVHGSPCGQCKCCKMIQNNINVDIIEIDAASNNGVDNIRELIEESKYMPQHGMYKVYIIDEVHMLSSSAFNALLKTLEEPTKNVVFILATTEEHKVPPTISSRCQRHQFKLLDDSVLVQALQDICSNEGINAEEQALKYVAKLAKGGLRDALSLLDQCTSFYKNIDLNCVYEVFGQVEDTAIAEIADCIEHQKIPEMFDLIRELEYKGKDLSNICIALYDHYRERCFNMMSSGQDTTILDRYMRVLAELSESMKHNRNRVVFEVNMIKMCKPQMETDYSSLYQRIRILEEAMEQILTNKSVTVELTPPKPIDKTDFVILQYRQPLRKRLVVSTI